MITCVTVDRLPEHVDLLPPLTRGCGRYGGELPLERGPRYARTREMGRWHRVRSGAIYRRFGDRVVWSLWCGYHISNGNYGECHMEAAPLGDLPVCGTCEGRALGAGQDPVPDGVLPPLVFSPRRLDPPARCPGSRAERLWVEIPEGHDVGRCLACGLLAPVRVSGGPYNPRVGLVAHAPGPGLVIGCPFHAWDNIARRDDPDGPVAACACGWGAAP